MKELFSIIIVAFFIFGCAGENSSVQPKEKVSMPKWIINPNIDGKRGAVGSCGLTYDQKISTRRKIAIQKALDELAMQEGVRVELDMKKKEEVYNQNVSSQTTINSNYKTTSANSIKAHIEDTWYDPYKDILYIWLVKD